MDYLLSVLVPTRNRIQYLRDCLVSLEMLDTNLVEIVVQDNSDKPEEIKDFIDSINKGNIFYYHDGRKLSQTENSELAMQHCTGEYVTYIGDDDSVGKTLVDLAMALKKNNLESCVYEASVYNWPDLREKLPGIPVMTIANISNDGYLISNNDLISQELKNGMQSVFTLPRIYHGIVSRTLLEKVHNIGGLYFPGPSPDMANAVACTLCSEKTLVLSNTLIVSGYGGNSAGGMGKRKLHKGSLKGNFQLRDDVEEHWNKKIPKRWMGCTIWPASASSAMEYCHRNELVKEINYGIIYAETLLHDFSSFNSIVKCIPSFSEIIVMFIHLSKRVVKILKRKISPTNNDELVIVDEMTLLDAVNQLNEYNRNVDLIKIVDEICGGLQ